MPLKPGTRVGPYEILGALGAGGMGEVYRARDARLGRDVAIKALRPQDTLDPESIDRFEREAQVLAALSHPHIAAIYGLEEAASAAGSVGRERYLVLELVEGGTLADRLSRGPLPIPEALTIGRQVADALHVAHDIGVIHRDLKPANVGLTSDGSAKVLDFGIAKVATRGPGDQTVAGATRTGLVLGTAAYMSPEQARGAALDRRTDIWSFGCLLYEMLIGRHPFESATMSDTIAGVLERDPDWSALPPATPPQVVRLLRRCLEKNRDRRLHDIADARIELDDALARPAESGVSVAQPGADVRPAARPWLPWAVAGLCLLVAVAAVLAALRPAPPSDADRSFHTSIVLPDEVRLWVSEDPALRFAISPDGRQLALIAAGPGGDSMLWLRPLDGLTPQPLAGTEGAAYPFWSPDSSAIAFLFRPRGEDVSHFGKLKRIDLPGGQVRTLGDAGFNSPGAWNRDGVILFTPTARSPLHRMSENGGPAEPVTSLDETAGISQHSFPAFLPDGRHFLYTALGSKAGGASAVAGIFIGSLNRAEPARLLLKADGNARYANGHLIYLRDDILVAQPFDVDRLALGGEALPLAEHPQNFSVSETGVLACQPGTLIRSQPAWFDRDGRRLSLLGEAADYVDIGLSPDGSRAAVSRLEPRAGGYDIWTFTVARGLAERITSDREGGFAPAWSPAGDRLAFSSVRNGTARLLVKGSHGSAPATPLSGGSDGGRFAADWSPDGNYLLFVEGGRTIARSDIWVMPLTEGRTPFAFVDSPFVETQPRFSPDGRWVTYTSNESGRLEVYVRPFPGPGDPVRVSVNGGRWLRWRRDGAEVFFISPEDDLMVSSIRTNAREPEIGPARALFRLHLRPRVRLDAYPYDVTADGQRFLVNTFVEDAASAPITLIVNWPASLKR